MQRTLSAALLAATIAITSLTATPVQAAPNNDLHKFMAGAIGLFILSQALEGRADTRQTRPPAKAVVTPKRKKLPASCFFKTRNRSGERGVFGKRCLREAFKGKPRFPKVCEDNIRIRHGRRANVYDARCMRQHGYKIRGRR